MNYKHEAELLTECGYAISVVSGKLGVPRIGGDCGKYIESVECNPIAAAGNYQWRSDRIKWCVKELGND